MSEIERVAAMLAAEPDPVLVALVKYHDRALAAEATIERVRALADEWDRRATRAQAEGRTAHTSSKHVARQLRHAIRSDE